MSTVRPTRGTSLYTIHVEVEAEAREQLAPVIKLCAAGVHQPEVSDGHGLARLRCLLRGGAAPVPVLCMDGTAVMSLQG